MESAKILVGHLYHWVVMHSTKPDLTFMIMWADNGVWSWARQWYPTPGLLPGKSHGQRSLVGCHPWGLKESDMTERLHFHFSLSRIGEGNGNPLQCSCLENPRDGGTWWAAVYGVTQLDTTEVTWQQQQHEVTHTNSFPPSPENLR